MKKKLPWDRNWLEKIYWKIRNFFFREWYFICKVWEYAKLFRRDYDFDYLSLLPIIELKTRRTREYLVDENLVHVDQRLMKEVEELCKRIYADDYMSKEWDEVHKAHPGAWRRIFNEDTGCYHSTMTDKEYGDTVRILHKKGEAQMEADLDRLFHIIRKHIRVWWS